MRQFSIRNFMGFTVIAAVGLASLRKEHAVWMGVLLLVSLCSGGYLALAIRNCQKTS